VVDVDADVDVEDGDAVVEGALVVVGADVRTPPSEQAPAPRTNAITTPTVRRVVRDLSERRATTS